MKYYECSRAEKNEIRRTKPNWETTHLNLTNVAATAAAAAFIPLMLRCMGNMNM